MSLFGGFFDDFYGFATSWEQLRPISPAEMWNLQAYAAMAQQEAASNSALFYEGLRNAFAPPEKPLDERFADLKVRLEKMLDRYPNARTLAH